MKEEERNGDERKRQAERERKKRNERRNLKTIVRPRQRDTMPP